MKLLKGNNSTTLRLNGSSVQLNFYSSSEESLLPGSGFLATTTRSDIDGGGSFSQAGTSTAVCWWTEFPFLVCGSTYGDTIDIGVVADHYNGIDKVGFVADGGAEVFVSSAITVDDVEQYRVTLDMSGKSAGDTVEVRAIAYPNHGRPRILQGAMQTDPFVADTNRQGFYSLKVTKTSAIQTTNVSSGTLLDAIESLGDISSSTVQHRLVFSTGTFENGTRGTLTAGNINELIPLIIEGSGARETIIDSSVDYSGGGCFESGLYHLKNLYWYGTTVTLRHRQASTSTNFGVLADDCYVGGGIEPVPDGHTHTDSDGVSVTVVSNPENKSVSRLYWERAWREYGNKTQVVTSGGDKNYGVWLNECTIAYELGDSIKWIKNCDSINNLFDSFHGGCMLNLDVQSASAGHEKPYTLAYDILNWQANKDFLNGAKVLVEVASNTWQILRNGSGSTINTSTFNLSDWADNVYPHNDAWQPRYARDGSMSFENIWLEGLTTDSDSVLQPMLYRESETSKDVVWKNWAITNTTEFISPLSTQIFTHMDHWVMKNCVWWEPGASGSTRSGELRINWIDSVDRGWGNTQADGSTIGCQNVKWIDSEVRGLLLTNSWPSPVPTNLTDFETFINGYATGWQIEIDQYTKDNS